MNSLRSKRKSLEAIYGPKLNALKQNSCVAQNSILKREENSVKIEHKCQKTGLLITLTTPTKISTGVNSKNTRGGGSCRVITNKPKNKNVNNTLAAFGANIKLSGKATSKNDASLSINTGKSLATLQEIEKSTCFKNMKREKSKVKIQKGEKKKSHYEKIFQLINIENQKQVSVEKPYLYETHKDNSMRNKMALKRSKNNCSWNANQTLNQEQKLEALQQDLQFQLKNEISQRHGEAIFNNFSQQILNQEEQKKEFCCEYNEIGDRMESVDSDTVEFVNYMRKAVEFGIKKALGSVLEETYCTIASKMEEFSSEVKNLHLQLRKFNDELNQNIYHYGEESSRNLHFLCMKSEYDKIFYQNSLNLPFSNSNASATDVTNSGKSFAKQFSFSSTVPSNLNELNSLNASCPPNDRSCSCSCSEIRSSTKSEKGKGDAPTTYERLFSGAPIQQTNSNTIEINKNQFNYVNHIENFCKRIKESEDQLELCIKPPTGTLYNSDEIMIINKEVFDDDSGSCDSLEILRNTTNDQMPQHDAGQDI